MHICTYVSIHGFCLWQENREVQAFGFPQISTAVTNESTPGQLLAIPQLPPVAFESTHRVRMSTINYNKCIDNKPLLLLPHPMFRSPSTSTNFQSYFDGLRFPLLDLLSVNSAPSVLKSRFHPSSAVPARARQPKPFRIRSSAKAPVTRLESAVSKHGT
jgi:hypothetical protein